MGRGDAALPPWLHGQPAAAAQGLEMGKNELGLGEVSVCGFIPQGSFYELYWAVGWAENSNEAEII